MEKAIVIGASGLIGANLINVLLADNSIREIVALVRNPLSIKHSKFIQHVVDFNNEQSYSEFVQGDAVFCCLGTTKKKSPDLGVYRSVDFEYPLAIARVALRNEVEQYHLVSSLGADSQSFVFYSRLKGELEESLKLLKFKCICIYQPSLLDGSRLEVRPTERIAVSVMRLLNPLLIGPLRKYRSIKASTLARAMVITAHKNLDGIFVYPSDKIKKII